MNYDNNISMPSRLKPVMVKPMKKIKYFNQTSDSIITVRIEELHNKTCVDNPDHIIIFIDKLTINHKDATHKFPSLALN